MLSIHNYEALSNTLLMDYLSFTTTYLEVWYGHCDAMTRRHFRTEDRPPPPRCRECRRQNAGNCPQLEKVLHPRPSTLPLATAASGQHQWLKAQPAVELHVGLTKTSIKTAPQLNFSLCPFPNPSLLPDRCCLKRQHRHCKVKKVGLREVKKLARSHTANEWYDWGWDPSPLMPEPWF